MGTRNDRRAMTLAEILVTLAVITCLFLPIIVMMQTGTIRVYRSADETLATIYATDMVEIIKGAPFLAFLPDGHWMDLREIFVENAGRIPSGYDPTRYDPRFIIKVKVTPAGKEYSADKIRMVRVVVQWDQRNTKKPKQREVATFYTPAK